MIKGVGMGYLYRGLMNRREHIMDRSWIQTTGLIDWDTLGYWRNFGRGLDKDGPPVISVHM